MQISVCNETECLLCDIVQYAYDIFTYLLTPPPPTHEVANYCLESLTASLMAGKHNTQRVTAARVQGRGVACLVTRNTHTHTLSYCFCNQLSPLCLSINIFFNFHQKLHCSVSSAARSSLHVLLRNHVVFIINKVLICLRRVLVCVYLHAITRHRLHMFLWFYILRFNSCVIHIEVNINISYLFGGTIHDMSRSV